MCSTMGESTRSSSFYNPTLSANKHVVNIFRLSLSVFVHRAGARSEEYPSSKLFSKAELFAIWTGKIRQFGLLFLLEACQRNATG